MNRKTNQWVVLPCLLLILSACEGADNNRPAMVDTKSSELVNWAKQDLADRLGVQSEDIVLLVEKNVTWRDGSLGCPREGMMYTQALVNGTLIVLRVGDTLYQYHSGKGRPPFYCENPVEPLPNSSAE